MRTRAEWRALLARYHRQSESAWLVYPKKSAPGFVDLTYDAIVERALCYGWIDSLPRKRDDGCGMLRVSPLRPRSAWSAANKRRVTQLTATGRMRAAGLAKVEAAKRDDSWAPLDAVEALTLPADLACSLAANAAARQRFEAFPPGSRTIILTWSAASRRPATRAARIAEAVRLAAQDRRDSHYQR